MNPPRFPFLLIAAVITTVTARADEGPAVTVITGANASAVERLAGEELKKTLVSLFDATVTLTNAPTETKNRILLGNPETNPAVKEAMGESWPADFREQDHLVKSTSQGLVLGGGSPIATLWAVAEFAHLNGIRVVPNGEYLPIVKPAFTLDGYETVLKPTDEIRAWRTLGSTSDSQASWAPDDLKALFRHLALMKFNTVVFSIQPSQVFAGTASEGSGIWEGDLIDVTGDLAGRSVFKGAKVFDHPALAEITNPEDRRDAAVAIVRETIKSARDLGLATQIELESDHEDDFDRITALYPEADSVGGMPGEKFLEAGWLGAGFFPYPEILDAEKGNQRGFLLHTRFVADQTATVWVLARESSGAVPDPDQPLKEFLLPICGEGVAEPFALGTDALVEAGRLILAEDPSFVASMVPNADSDTGGFIKFYRSSDPVPEWWSKAKELYGKAVGEFYRANTRARDGARPLILRHAKRATFALHYMTAAEFARNAGIANTAGDDDARVENLELAIEAMHNALAIYAEVATENGDAGALAILNEFAYRPLLQALEEGD